jgi:DNA-binding GntR family transcriptional regulator
MIRDSICDFTLEPGTHLVQEELAARLRVSRQPVQQAMLLLKADGLVVESGARGLYVAPIDEAGITQRYQIRVVLDQLAAELVAQRAAASTGFAAELRRQGEAIMAEGIAACERGEVRESVAHDVAFHSFLYEMSGNPLIATTAEPHWHFLRRVMIQVFLKAARGDLVWQQHREILEALVAGDAPRARELVTAHVGGAQIALLETMAS